VSVPEVVVFSDIGFSGDSWETQVGWNWVGSSWNDSISSIIVVSGTWQFYGDANMSGTYSRPIGPGYYPWVEDDFVNIWNDSISSFQVVSYDPIDLTDPVSISTIDLMNWTNTGWSGSVTVSNAAANAFNHETGYTYPSYGINPQPPPYGQEP
jgi:Beta/Gamma crystallin